MPTEAARAWRADITKEVTRLRRQFVFLFILLVGAVILYGLKNASNTSQIQALVDQVREDRYASCEARRTQLNTYNARVELSLSRILDATNPTLNNVDRTRLKTEVAINLQFPLPTCPPDPSP